MADELELQREARRQKILNNAEKRMNRLLGKPTEIDSKDEINLETPTSPLANKQPENSDVLKTQEVHTSPYNLRSRHPRLSSPGEVDLKTSKRVVDNVKSPDIVFSSREIDTPVFENEVDAKRSDKDSEVQPSLKIDKLPAKAGDHSADMCLALLKNLNAQTYELSKVAIFFMLAFISRQLLKIGIGLFIVQSIFYPFLILELTVIYVSHVYLKHIPLKTSRGNLMSAALMLCGIKQDVMESYHFIMAHANSALSDFCVYLFAFVVCFGLT